MREPAFYSNIKLLCPLLPCLRNASRSINCQTLARFSHIVYKAVNLFMTKHVENDKVK